MGTKIILTIVLYFISMISVLSQDSEKKSSSYLPSKDLLIGKWADESDSLSYLVIDKNTFRWYSSSDSLLSFSLYRVGDSCMIQNNKLFRYRYIRFINEDTYFEILGLNAEYLTLIDLKYGYISINKRIKTKNK